MLTHLLLGALAILATAVLSSLATLALGAWLFEHRARPRLEDEIDRRVEEAIEELGREVEERVRRGVAVGLADGVASLPSAEVLRGATRTATRSGFDVLATILSGGRRPPSGDDES